MKRRMLESDDSSGSILKGLIVTLISLVFLGPFLAIGWFISGVFGGLTGRGSVRGLASGLIGGLIATVVIIELSYYLPASLITAVTNFTGNIYLLHYLTETYMATKASLKVDTLKTIIGVVIEITVIPALGGLVGGSILSKDNN